MDDPKVNPQSNEDGKPKGGLMKQTKQQLIDIIHRNDDIKVKLNARIEELESTNSNLEKDKLELVEKVDILTEQNKNYQLEQDMMNSELIALRQEVVTRKRSTYVAWAITGFCVVAGVLMILNLLF